MAATWPITLEQLLNESGFAIEFPKSWIESETDIGPKKRRRRTTQTYEKLSCSILMEKSLYTTFKNFYDVTLSGGTLPFEFAHPITQVTTEYKMDVPQISPAGGLYFTVSMSWEEQP
jgi:hypothetical protein